MQDDLPMYYCDLNYDELILLLFYNIELLRWEHDPANKRIYEAKIQTISCYLTKR